MSILWIVLIVILVLALLGFFCAGTVGPNLLVNRPPGPLPGGLCLAKLDVCGAHCIRQISRRCCLGSVAWPVPTVS